MMAAFANRPGPTAAARPRGGRHRAASRSDAARPTLVMFAHPQCDCTRASLAELAELMARAAQRPNAFVVFIQPRGVASDWEAPRIVARRGPDPGRDASIRDDDGVEAKRFGARNVGTDPVVTTATDVSCSAAGRRARADTSATTPASNRSWRCSVAADSLRRPPRSSAVRCLRRRISPDRGEDSWLRRSPRRAWRRCPLTLLTVERRPAARRRHSFAPISSGVYRRTDRVLAQLMCVQWIAGIIFAIWVSPRRVVGRGQPDPRARVGRRLPRRRALRRFPVLLAVFRPGEALTRYTIAVAQMLMGALLIHLTGGTHRNALSRLRVAGVSRVLP